MHKAKIATKLSIVFAGAVVLLLSACSLFQDTRHATYAIDGADARKFAAGIRPQKADAGALYRLGLHLQERGRHRAAIAEFRAAVKADPGHAKACNAMGVSYDALGEHRRAIESYTAALTIAPQFDCAVNNLGYAYLLQGHADLAIVCFKKALELDGGNNRYRNNLAMAYAECGRYDEALAAFQANGSDEKAFRNIAQLYYRKGLYAQAQVYFEKADRLRSFDPETRTGLQAAVALGKIFAAKESQLSEPVQAGTMPPAPSAAGVAPGRTLSLPVAALATPGKLSSAHRSQGHLPFYGAAIARDFRPQVLPQALRRTIAPMTLISTGETRVAQSLRRHVADAANARGRLVRIEVSNGNGVRSMARTVGNFLKEKDIVLMYLSNAAHFNHGASKIYYTEGYLPQARRLAQRLPGEQQLESVATIRGGQAEISILIGKDLISHSNRFDKV